MHSNVKFPASIVIPEDNVSALKSPVRYHTLDITGQQLAVFLLFRRLQSSSMISEGEQLNEMKMSTIQKFIS